MYIEKKSRSILKTLSWRVCATLATCLIVFIFTGKIFLAVSIGAVEVIVKLLLYFFHERAWNKIFYGKKQVDSFVLWFTGLSGSGKSTLANKVYGYLQKKGYKVEHLDGDTVRSVFPKTGFTKEDRDSHVKRVGFLASILERNGVIVVSSFVSPYNDAREFVRGLCKNYIEVYVKASIETCEKRDVKGLYKKVRAGEIKNFTGIDDPYEEPVHPEIIIDSDHQTFAESFNVLKKHIDQALQERPFKK